MAYTANIIPAMTSATAPNGIVSASSEFDATRAAWKAFDHLIAVPADSWLPTAGVTGWIQYRFPALHGVVRYAITSINQGTPFAPKSWTFKGSINGSTWVTLDTQTNITDWATSPNVRKVFDFANAGVYTYYRLDITASNDASSVGVGELEMMERARDFPVIGSNIIRGLGAR